MTFFKQRKKKRLGLNVWSSKYGRDAQIVAYRDLRAFKNVYEWCKHIAFHTMSTRRYEKKKKKTNTHTLSLSISKICCRTYTEKRIKHSRAIFGSNFRFVPRVRHIHTQVLRSNKKKSKHAYEIQIMGQYWTPHLLYKYANLNGLADVERWSDHGYCDRKN